MLVVIVGWIGGDLFLFCVVILLIIPNLNKKEQNSGGMHQFKKLEIWKRSQEMCLNVHGVTSGFPKSEMFGLQSQIRRCSVSIPSNIAEGTSRNSDKEFNRFIEIALGSAYELETQLIIANRLNYIEKSTFDSLSEELNALIQMTMKFRSRLRPN